MPWRDVLLTCFETFASTTVIRVFNFIRISSFILERLFWLAILIGFSVVTVWNLWTTAVTFSSEPTTSLVSFEEKLPLTFQNATVCVEINSAALTANYGSDEVVERTLNSFSLTPDVLQYFKSKIDQVRQTYPRTANLIDNNFQAYLETIHQHIERVFNRDDLALIGITTLMLGDIVKLEQQAYTTGGNASAVVWKTSAAERAHDFYTSRDTDFGALLRLTAQLTCIVLELKVHVYNYDQATSTIGLTEFDFCGLLSPPIVKMFGFSVFANAEVMCLRVPKNHSKAPLRFERFQDELIVTLRLGSLYKPQQLSFMPIDLAGQLSLDKQPLLLVQPLNVNQQIFFDLQVINSALDLARKPCSSSLLAHDCATWCRADFIDEACKCVSLETEFLRDVVGFPAAANYCGQGTPNMGKRIPFLSDPRCIQLLANVSMDDSTKRCSRNCLPNCKTYLFTYAVPSSATPSANFSQALIKPQKFIYQTISEKLTMDWKVLMSTIGGNLSLYLGASFLALIHIIVFVLKMPFDRSLYRKAVPAMETGGKLVGAFGVRQIFSTHSRDLFELNRRVDVLEQRLRELSFGGRKVDFRRPSSKSLK